MDSSHSQHHNISSTNKRKRGRPRKDEVVGSTDTSPHMSPPPKKPIGRPRKDGYVRPSNTKSHSTSVQQKRPVGRPKKVNINPIDNNRKTATGQSEPLTMTKTTSCHGIYNGPNAKLCTLLPRPPNQYLSLLNNSLVQAPYSSQLTSVIGHSCDDNRNGVTGTSRHSKDTLSFDDVSYSESHEYVEDDIIDGDDGEDFNNCEDAIDNDTILSLTRDNIIDDDDGGDFNNSEDAIVSDAIMPLAQRDDDEEYRVHWQSHTLGC